jgi:uncharacterized protein YndB with AHSA1/START domain
MDKSLTTTQTIEIKAGAEKVWDALINPDKIRQYLFGTNARSDWKKGSTLTFEGEWEGKKYKDQGVITDIREKQLLQYTYLSDMSGMEDKPENYILVTFKMGSNGEHTTLSLTQDGAANQEALEHSAKNWKMVLEKIKEVVEKQE